MKTKPNDIQEIQIQEDFIANNPKNLSGIIHTISIFYL